MGDSLRAALVADRLFGDRAEYLAVNVARSKLDVSNV